MATFPSARTARSRCPSRRSTTSGPRGTTSAAMVIGRRLFDVMDGWQGQPPVGDHVVVVSHRPKPDGWHPEASYHFDDDVAAAVSKASELAGDRTVAVAGRGRGGPAVAAGIPREGAVGGVPGGFRAG